MAALTDWVKALNGHSQAQIDEACEHYIRNQPSRRPTPADIANRISENVPRGENKQAKLSRDKLDLLHTEILPTARQWVTSGSPTLAQHGMATLQYWGEATG